MRVGVGGSMCSVIHSPVFCIRFVEGMAVKNNIDTPFIVVKRVKWEDSYSESNIDVRPIARKLLKEYPWPRYKGLQNNKGIVNFTPDSELKLLREVAAGEHCPWGSKWAERWGQGVS